MQSELKNRKLSEPISSNDSLVGRVKNLTDEDKIRLAESMGWYFELDDDQQVVFYTGIHVVFRERSSQSIVTVAEKGGS
jgi:hypothetical protein